VRTSPTFVVKKALTRGTRKTPRLKQSAFTPASVMLSPVPAVPALDGAAVRGAQIGAPRTREKPRVRATSVRVAVDATLSRAILGEVNRVRRRHGLRVLAAAPALVRAGNEHARFLAASGTFTHDWHAGTPFGRWILRFYPAAGFRAWSAGENLLWWPQTVTARGAVQRWLASPPHRHVLLTPRWRQLGIGVVDAADAPGVYGGQTVVVAAAEFGLRSR
jgi:uncharacterized protein YkwD